MTRPRFPARLFLAGLLLVAGQPVSRCLAQRHSLFPNAPARSEALRNPKRQAVPPPRPDTVPLPFNLYWGDSQQRLASLFAGVGAQVTSKKSNGPVEIWTVQGLIAPNLQTSLFAFQQGILIGLEFDYGQPTWDIAKYNDVMGQFRKLLEAACQKEGEIISRQTDQPAADPAVKQSLMGYQWQRGDTLVQLFYFSAEDPAKSLSYRSISVHYHYQDPYAVAEGPGAGAAGAGTGPSLAPGANPAASPSLFPHALSPLSPDADPLPEK